MSSLYVPTIWSSKLIVDYDSMGPSRQLFGDRYLQLPTQLAVM